MHCPRLRLLVLLLPLLGSLCCGRAHLFYETRELRHQPIGDGQKNSLTHTVAAQLGGRTVTWVDPDGREQAITPDEAGLRRLPLDVLGALWLATATGDRGGEADVRVHRRRGGPAPVSVYVDLEGNVRVVSPRRGSRPERTPVLSESAIRERFGLKRDLAGKWNAPEREAFAASLALLPDKVLRSVQGVQFARREKHKSGDTSRAALYEQQGCKAVIYLYATGVEADCYRFVGEPSAPRSAVLHSILHEIGHAYEQTGSRERHCEAQRSSGNKRNRLIREGNRFLLESPVISAYQHALDGEPAPTDYGNTNPHESFAEAFALFYTDPDALRRAAPNAYAWFAAGGHVESQPDSR